MKDLGIVIFSHTLSLTSSPDPCLATALATWYIGVLMVNLAGPAVYETCRISSNPVTVYCTYDLNLAGKC